MIRSSSCVICWGNKILLFHRDNISTITDPDCWQFPGGGVEEGESHLEGLRRELGEEVSYVPTAIRLLAKLKGQDRQTNIYFCFVDDIEAGRFKLGVGEGQEIGFFTPDEMKKLKLSPRVRYYLERFEKSIEGALMTKNFGKLKLQLALG